MLAFIAGAVGYKPYAEPAAITAPVDSVDPSGIGAMILRFPDGAVKVG